MDDDTPQGGAGGVPLHHNGEPHGPHEHPEPPERRTDTVKTVRAGTPVAEQKATPVPSEPDERDDA
ncbi:hypothetical protein F7Q99_32830 [Streptomyces kaniharaensis]|uniref:Uncharacterized protein n=1 Tax=Streptomyces kaniharaensis TaxID=212423 RepID=A0A6N7L145_9ACTN|nr:hypothetical protein [Streptomyces kaniharaensis]MQS16845.1 hypothetical protein [Streptomyces kaniharaensis]